MSTTRPAASHKCSATTRAGGLCPRPPRKDHDSCLAHADEETRAAAGFGGKAVGDLGSSLSKLVLPFATTNGT